MGTAWTEQGVCGSRALPSAVPAKLEFSDFSGAAAAHQRGCLFGFLKRRTNEQRRKAGGRGVGGGPEKA